ncbi:MAG: hypothetical protein R3F59_37765, partial [Myxococcota bacterium]
VRGSYPVIGVHLNLPGVWQGYQEVGRLYNDQMLFTLGNHWLDNFSHPSLKEAALYRLRQYPDGSFIHIINPDLQDQYQVTSTNQGGASVLTLATRADGQPLAYIVLAVIDPPVQLQQHASPAAPPVRAAPAAVPTSPVPPPRRPDIRMPSPPPPDRDSPPSIAPPMMLDETPAPTSSKKIGLGGKTIIPDAPSERIFTLQERGALLQKVHFSAFMLGYDVYLGTRGELGTHVESPAATFQVRKRAVSLVAHVDGVVVDGQMVPAGSEVPIEGNLKIEVAGQKLEYRDLRGTEADGWPYVGEIRRPASSTYVIWGEDYQIGRSRECRVVLPDEARNDNIHWKPSVGDGATIRARTGEIPKARFYTDSIMVASEHASMDLRGDIPKVVCTARHCYVYIRRNDALQTLYPTTTPQLPKEMELLPGDEVLIGNCLFHVGYTMGEAAEPAPAPRVELSEEGEMVPAAPQSPADSLAGAVSPPDLQRLDQDTVPPAPARNGMPTPVSRTTPPPPEVRPSDLHADGANGANGASATPPTAPAVQRPPLSDQPSTSKPLGSDGWIEPPRRRRRPPPPPEPDPEPEPERLDELDLDPISDEPTAPDLRQPSDSLSGLQEPPRPPPLALDGDVDDVPDVGGWDLAAWPEEAAPTEPPGPPKPPVASDAAPQPEPDPDDIESDLSVDAPGANRAGASLPPEGAGEVVFIDDAEAQFEIGRPMHLVLAGWALNGEVVCGNHTGCDLRLPENRIRPDQALTPRDYFRLKVRGNRGTLDVLDHREVEIDGGDALASYDDPSAHKIEVIRRDDVGERDFTVVLQLVEERRLPDPRARFLAIDTHDPLARALVTRGLPKGAARTLTLDGIEMTLLYDGDTVTFGDYLPTYRRGDGYHPFFVQKGDARFVTAPEDGASFALSPGDRLVVGTCVYELRAE